MFCYQSYSLIRAVLVSISLLGFPPTEKSKLFLQRCVTVLFTEMLFTLTDCQQLNHFLVRCILGIFTLQFILKYKVVFGRQLQIFGVSCQVFICWCVCVYLSLKTLLFKQCSEGNVHYHSIPYQHYSTNWSCMALHIFYFSLGVAVIRSCKKGLKQ